MQAMQEVASFAARLGRLFELVRTPPDEHGTRRPYTTAEVSHALNQLTDGHTDQREYLRALLNGRRANPSLDKMAALAHVFGQFAKQMGTPGADTIDWATEFNRYLAVPADTESARIVEQMHENYGRVLAARTPRVMQLARQLEDLDEEDLAGVQEVVNQALERAGSKKKGLFGRRSPG